jgi:hypothetical protein
MLRHRAFFEVQNVQRAKIPFLKKSYFLRKGKIFIHSFDQLKKYFLGLDGFRKKMTSLQFFFTLPKLLDLGAVQKLTQAPKWP